MRKRIGSFRSPHLWIALGLVAINGLAWLSALGSSEPVCTTEPVLEPSLADMRERLIEGGHSGETFDLHVTDREAFNSIAWFLNNNPQVPFRHPCIAFHDQELEAWGETDVLGLRLSLYGRATMVLEDEVPVVTLTELSVAGAVVPRFVLEAIEDAVYQQVNLSDRQLPVIFETLELREGEVVSSGTFR